MVLIDPSGPWLLPSFKDRGYHITPKSQHLTLASEVMKRLIDRLNAAIKKAAGAYPSRAYYVDLAGTLAKKYGDADKYKLLWANELHPNEEGFDLLAAQVAKQLKELKID
jgi:lysophospholipase L1-like esterase